MRRSRHPCERVLNFLSENSIGRGSFCSGSSGLNLLILVLGLCWVCIFWFGSLVWLVSDVRWFRTFRFGTFRFDLSIIGLDLLVRVFRFVFFGFEPFELGFAGFGSFGLALSASDLLVWTFCFRTLWFGLGSSGLDRFVWIF